MRLKERRRETISHVHDERKSKELLIMSFMQKHRHTQTHRLRALSMY